MIQRLRKIADFLGLKRSIFGVLSMCVLIGMGEKMAERFLPIYLIALGGGPLIVAALNSLDNLLSALYSYPGGWLSDAIGTKKALMVFNILAMIGYVIVLAVPSYLAVLVGAAFFISWTALSLPATMSLISEVLPKNKRTMGVSVHSFIRRIPMALGPLIGGALVTAYGATVGVRYAFIAALGMAVVALFFQQIMMEEKPKKNPEIELQKGVDQNPGKSAIFFDRNLKILLISDIFVRYCEQIPYPFVVVWCMNLQGLSGNEFGVLTTIEMVTAMLIYIPIAWFADRSGKKVFVVITFLFFTMFPLVLLFSNSFWPLVFAFIVRGLKEFGEPSRKALIMDLCPEGKKAEGFGKYYLLRDLAVSVGAMAGGFLWKISPTVNFMVAFGFGIVGTALFAIKGKDFSK